MRRSALAALIATMAFAATPAAAEYPEFCADRPGIGTAPCTLAPGTAMFETTIAQWDHSADAQTFEDKLTLGGFAVRVGVTQSAEVQFGLTSYIRDRMLDRPSGLVSQPPGLGTPSSPFAKAWPFRMARSHCRLS